MASIISKIEHGTIEQRKWVLDNAKAINSEINEMNKIREQLGMTVSPLNQIPEPPLKPTGGGINPNFNQVNPRSSTFLTGVENALFYGGALLAASGANNAIQGGYAAGRGTYAFFKAGEEVAKEAAKATAKAGAESLVGGVVRIVAAGVAEKVSSTVAGYNTPSSNNGTP